MTETEILLKLFNDHYNGSPWIDVNLKDSLSNTDAATAPKKQVHSTASGKYLSICCAGGKPFCKDLTD
jgi:hypothetical protein